MWAVVGLGNPGRRYAETRHNVGFMFIKAVAKAWDVRVKKNKFLSRTAEVRRGSKKVILAMPQTFMNSSGEAVRELVRGMRRSAAISSSSSLRRSGEAKSKSWKRAWIKRERRWT